MSRAFLDLWVSPYPFSHYLALRTFLWDQNPWPYFIDVETEVQKDKITYPRWHASSSSRFQFNSPDSWGQHLFLVDSPVSSLVVPSAGCMTSAKPLSLGRFESSNPCQLWLWVLYSCPWARQTRVFGSIHSFCKEAAVTLPPLGSLSWLPKAELSSLVVLPQHSQPCIVIYLQTPRGPSSKHAWTWRRSDVMQLGVVGTMTKQRAPGLGASHIQLQLLIIMPQSWPSVARF